jgi:large subunit ribosomal protein L27Ae
MRHFHKTQQMYHCPTINLDKLWTLVSEEQRAEAKAKSSEGVAPVIDVTKSVCSPLSLSLLVCRV